MRSKFKSIFHIIDSEIVQATISKEGYDIKGRLRYQRKATISKEGYDIKGRLRYQRKAADSAHT